MFIYGIDSEKPVSALMVRDALTECFFRAHCDDAHIGDNAHIEKLYCQTVVQKFFEDVGGSYEYPTKEVLTRVMVKLADYAMHFRDPSVITAHQDEIELLMAKIQ